MLNHNLAGDKDFLENSGLLGIIEDG